MILKYYSEESNYSFGTTNRIAIGMSGSLVSRECSGTNMLSRSLEHNRSGKIPWERVVYNKVFRP